MACVVPLVGPLVSPMQGLQSLQLGAFRGTGVGSSQTPVWPLRGASVNPS